MAGFGDEFRKVQQGDPLLIGHNAWSTLMDVADAFKRGQRGQQAAQANAGGNDPTTVYVQNTTGGNLARFAVVGLGEAVFDSTSNPDNFRTYPQFQGVTPSAANHTGKFAILQEPAALNDVVIAVVSGVSVVQLNVVNTTDVWADVDDGTSDDLLTYAEEGSAQILWKEAGTGVGIWSIVRIGPPPPRRMFVVKLVKNSGSNGTATTFCSYMYDVFVYGTTIAIATNQSVIRSRDRVGPVTAADAGYAQYLADGTFALLEAWEVWDAGACP